MRNVFFIAGTVTNPQFYAGKDGKKSVITITLINEVSEKYTEQTCFKAFGDLADRLAGLPGGTRILVTGTPRLDTRTTQDGKQYVNAVLFADTWWLERAHGTPPEPQQDEDRAF